MRSEDEMRDLLTTAAEEIADFSGNPRTWLTWITFLLDKLDDEAMNVNPAYQELYHDLLYALMDAIRNRLKSGGW
ncbi:MAG: hypothetical protein ACWGO1_02660 [Anaerolineales bacterium]